MVSKNYVTSLFIYGTNVTILVVAVVIRNLNKPISKMLRLYFFKLIRTYLGCDISTGM